MEPLFNIQAAVRRTGLSAHRIRAWERRYDALRPARSESQRRLYSESDIRRLTLLRRAVESGQTISQAARLSDAQLEAVAPAGPAEAPRAAVPPLAGGAWLEAALDSVRRLDHQGLERLLTQASSDLGAAALLEGAVLPLLETVGREWSAGTLRPAHEHMATAVIRSHLGHALAMLRPPDNAPLLVAAAPAGQLHELGALAAALSAAQAGWRVLYLGADLPADEIAGAARKTGARAVALSIVFPPDDPRLPEEILALRRAVGPDVALLAGGSAVEGYRDALRSAGALLPSDLSGLREQLARERTAAAERP